MWGELSLLDLNLHREPQGTHSAHYTCPTDKVDCRQQQPAVVQNLQLSRKWLQLELAAALGSTFRCLADLAENSGLEKLFGGYGTASGSG